MSTHDNALVLGIESSCDETAAAVVDETGRVLSDVVSTQVDIHRRWGGVVPELASRNHVVQVLPVVDEALRRARCSLQDLDLIAVTRGPGLLGALLVGVQLGKSLSVATGIPLVGVNHLEGHLLAARLLPTPPEPPFLALVVSGGHTSLYAVKDFGQYTKVGSTRDDAAGEAYDKVAKLLGLGFPGGPILDRLAREGNREAFAFPRPMLDQPGLDFSFSGLKTAVLLAVRPHGEPPYPDALLRDVAASFQGAVVDTLVARSMRAVDQVGAAALNLGGGVACNRELRERLGAECERRGVALRVPSPRLCADNAAMIAQVGAWQLARDGAAETDLDVVSSLEESGLPVTVA